MKVSVRNANFRKYFSCESGPGVVSEFLSVSKSLLEVVMRCRAVFYI